MAIHFCPSCKRPFNFLADLSQHMEKSQCGELPPLPGSKLVEIKTLSELEKSAIENALAHFKGNGAATAQALGVSVATINRKIGMYGINRKAYR